MQIIDFSIPELSPELSPESSISGIISRVIRGHSVEIRASSGDNIKTLCRLRRASGRPPDDICYMLCTGQPSSI